MSRSLLNCPWLCYLLMVYGAAVAVSKFNANIYESRGKSLQPFIFEMNRNERAMIQETKKKSGNQEKSQSPQKIGKGGVGSTYVRWGRSTCPKVLGTSKVYEGRVAGSHYSHRGGGANYLCIAREVQHLQTAAGFGTNSLLYGTEYQTSSGSPSAYRRLHDHDVPCAVCYISGRGSVLMIPGRYTCPTGWTTEYYGYIMSERYNHHRATFECVDNDPEITAGGHANHDGALFYFVEPRCGSLQCPPYDPKKEITCAVCSW